MDGDLGTRSDGREDTKLKNCMVYIALGLDRGRQQKLQVHGEAEEWFRFLSHFISRWRKTEILWSSGETCAKPICLQSFRLMRLSTISCCSRKMNTTFSTLSKSCQRWNLLRCFCSRTIFWSWRLPDEINDEDLTVVYIQKYRLVWRTAGDSAVELSHEEKLWNWFKTITTFFTQCDEQNRQYDLPSTRP